MNVPLRYNVRSILERKTRTALTVLGIAAVVAVFVAMVTFGQGLAASFGRAGSPDNVDVLQKGAFSQSLFSLPRSSGDVIPYAPHVRKRGGRILASPELSIEPWVTAPGTNEPVFMQARGVNAVFFEVADTVVVTDGRRDLRGNRVLLGRGARRKLGGIGPGATLTMLAAWPATPR